MFQFPAFASVKNGYPGFTGMGCPIRKSPDYKLFALPRSLSQLVTSFIASESLGIHRTPLFTFLNISLTVTRYFIQHVKELLPNQQAMSKSPESNRTGKKNRRPLTDRFEINFCGEYRSRTDDLLRAKQAL